MRNLNRVTLIGYLAADPDLKASESGISVATFPVATNRDWKSADGEKKEAVDYHKVVAFRKLADICVKYLAKGTPLCLEGRLQNSSFETKEGKKHYTTEIVLDNLFILSYEKKDGKMQVDVKEVGKDD